MDISSLSVFDKIAGKTARFYDAVETSRPIAGKRKKAAWAIVATLCFGIILALNILTPISADDFGYMYIHATDTKVVSFADIIQSQINHYLLWGGRSVVHIIAQSLLLLPSVVIDILNSLAYIGFVFLIYFHVVGRGKGSLGLFIVINAMLCILLPAYGDTVLWITGSSNYLWGTSLVLLMLLPYRLYRGQRGDDYRRVLTAVILFVLGILAGWTNENTAAAMLLVIVLFLVYYRSANLAIPVWAVTGLLGGIIGYVLMIAAPGNYVRAGEAVFFSPFLFVYRFLTYTQTLFTVYGFFNLLYIIFIILWRRFAQPAGNMPLKFSFIYLAGMLVSVYAMLLSPSFPSRAWFGPVIFNLMAFGAVFHNPGCDRKFMRQIRCAVVVFSVIISGFVLYDGLRDIVTFNNVSKERSAIVAQAKKEGAKQCVFERYTARSKFVHTEEPTSHYMMSRYYGVEVVFGK